MRKSWLPGQIHIFQNHLQRDLKKGVDLDELRANMEHLGEGEPTSWTEAELGQVAMIWLKCLFILDARSTSGIGLYHGSRRSVGNIAQKINITVIEAMEFFREVLIDIVREIYRDPIGDEE